MSIEKFNPSYDVFKERSEKLKVVAPEAFEDGKINFDILKETLGFFVDEENPEKEHFSFVWPGKREARRLAGKPPQGCLIPLKGEGVNEDKTENVIIEGDNLEVLKLMQKSYAGEIKMIYIDPPYNTGNDFIYKDNFEQPLAEYLKLTGQMDEQGNSLVSNKKSDGRFHSKWMNMIYPRLLLARDLLRDDGVIFISIDDREIDNLRKICSEIFGEENFCAQFVWNTEGNTDNQYQVKVNHEYVVAYFKNILFCEDAIGHVIDPNTPKESNLWKGIADNNINKNHPANPPSIVELPIGFPSSEKELFYRKKKVDDEFFKQTEKEKIISDETKERYGIEEKSGLPVKLDDMVVKNFKLIKPCRIYVGMANKNKLLEFIANDCKAILDEGTPLKFYININAGVRYQRENEKPRNILSVLRGMGTTEKTKTYLKNMGIYYDYPKPVQLIEYLVKIGCENDGIVMDFFAGSGTTAQAVLELNKLENKNRKFILIQLPEPINKKSHRTLFEITKDRVSKVIKELKKDSAQLGLTGEAVKPESGFKVFKLQKTNFKIWKDYAGNNTEELTDLFSKQENGLVDGWKKDDLTIEIMLQEGFPLNSVVAKQKELKTNEIIKISSDFCEHALFVCLDKKLDQSTLNKLSLSPKDIFICLDSALTDEQKVILKDKAVIKTI